MTGEEVVGPAGPKLVRMLYFVGAGCNDLLLPLPLLLPYASTIYQLRKRLNVKNFAMKLWNYPALKQYLSPSMVPTLVLYDREAQSSFMDDRLGNCPS
ncbi:hypothetical protein RHMOL_Rhmol06G0266400 [Rhododendron molle]|uniref:Uncharacterized protein n=1 Tax=Rhododendron molle TaxID=49168 RepID=A0ACC0NHB8_RHOML|nr:hypothetical protein RHMOL_Rhmol06G0266400 [Rhododendron molle]